MGVIIDSSILIASERGHIDFRKMISGRENEEFHVSVITVSELLHGVWRAQDPGIRVRRSTFVEQILESFPILPIDLSTARIHAQLWAGLSSSGTMIGSHDSWIAASCLAHGCILATTNIREFERVSGLTVENWLDSS